MKSRTSSCNLTIFRKDMSRFFPAWLLYGIFLLLSFVMILEDTSSPADLAEGAGYTLNAFSVINCGYAFLMAQLLFGDLYSSRMCNALHAMPMRRETWFATHLLAGFLYSLLPNLVVSILAMPFLEELWYVSLLWLLGVELSYLFFFGVAVLSALCVGNRFAMTLVYGIINFAAWLIYWIAYTLYDPLLMGINLDTEWFLVFCPFVQLISFEFISVSTSYVNQPWLADFPASELVYTLSYEGWWYLGIVAAVGAVFLITALLLYRRRHLESAGDFITVHALSPVFLIAYTLCAGTALQLFWDLFMGDGALLFLFVGMAIGFFTGQMLLQRNVKVFTKRTFAGFGIFAAVLGLSLLLTWLDPIGITRYVPQVQDIKDVGISTSRQYYSDGLTLTEDADIAAVTDIHQYAVENRMDTDSYAFSGESAYFSVSYRMDNGSTVVRSYRIPVDSAQGQVFESLMSRKEAIFGAQIADLDAYIENLIAVTTDYDGSEIPADDIPSLMEALLADCEAGTMAQDWNFHGDEDVAYWLGFQFRSEGEINTYLDIRISESNTNTNNWLRQRGYMSWLDEKYE